jgi:YD repeat-containing protein
MGASTATIQSQLKLSDSDRHTYYSYDAAGHQIRTRTGPSSVYDQTAAVNNGTVGTAQVFETSKELSVEVTYDALGNAVVNRDTAGNYTFKVYDANHQVIYDIDARGYITQYERNAFGQVVSLTRYSVPATALVNARKNGPKTAEGFVQGISRQSLEDVLPSLRNGLERTIQTSYDTAGRVTRTEENAVFYYDASSQTTGTGGKVTVNTYDTLGQLIRTGVKPTHNVLMAGSIPTITMTCRTTYRHD